MGIVAIMQTRVSFYVLYGISTKRFKMVESYLPGGSVRYSYLLDVQCGNSYLYTEGSVRQRCSGSLPLSHSDKGKYLSSLRSVSACSIKFTLLRAFI